VGRTRYEHTAGDTDVPLSGARDVAEGESDSAPDPGAVRRPDRSLSWDFGSRSDERSDSRVNAFAERFVGMVTLGRQEVVGYLPASALMRNAWG
jgi:hypothetical protein